MAITYAFGSMRALAVLTLVLAQLTVTAPAWAKQHAAATPARKGGKATKPAPVRALASGVPWRGALRGAIAFPERGPGFVTPATWQLRGLRFGTRELVDAVMRAAARVDGEHPGVPLFVGDLSPARGGPSAWHRSHQNGLDVDLMFYAIDEDGAPAPEPLNMQRFDPETLRAGGLRFDLARNWQLVRALLTDKKISVDMIIVHEGIEASLLTYAAAIGEPAWLRERAEAALRQARSPHDDHFHVRLGCPAGHASAGCGVEPPRKKKGKKVQARRR